MKFKRLFTKLYFLKIVFSFFTLVMNNLYGESISISPSPIKVIDFPTDFIDKNTVPLFSGTRSRLAICSGVSWFHNDEYLAAVGLVNSSLQIYELNSETAVFNSIQSLYQVNGAALSYPVALSIAEDQQLMAITNNKNGTIVFYKLDSLFHTIDPHPISAHQFPKDSSFHGVRFSPKENYVAFTSIGTPDGIAIHRFTFDESRGIVLTCTQFFKNPFHPLKPKGIDFSPNGKFVVVCYSNNANPSSNMPCGLLATYRFDLENGMIDPNPISIVGNEARLSEPEDVVFYPDSTTLFVSNQGNDTVTIHAFDQETGMLGKTIFCLESPEAQLSFPHGLSISSDGKRLAVTQHGSSKIMIYTICRK
jgi:6-phosphogluconolactonase (cycloisomerase 2 family)